MYTITLRQTSEEHPEQYSAFVGSRQVAYLRLRWGKFAVYVPNYVGKLIYEKTFANVYMGHFESQNQRNTYLNLACSAIAKYDRKDGKNLYRYTVET